MTPGQPTRVIAGCIGLCGFVVALLVGLAVANPLDVILLRAVMSLAACVGVGLVVGYLGERAVRHHIAATAVAARVGAEARAVASAGAGGGTGEEPRA